MKAGSASALAGERSFLSCDQGSDRWLAGVDVPGGCTMLARQPLHHTGRPGRLVEES